LLVFAALLPALASATTYTCIGGDGRKSFSDRPCPTSNADNARRDASAAG
jgi:Domain of unknown function (DUF4124)